MSLLLRHLTGTFRISFFEVRTFTFLKRTFIFCARPHPIGFTVSFLSPSAVPAASSGSRPRSNPFPESDYSDPPAEPVQTRNTMSADRALHSGRWHTWSRMRSGPWHWIWPKPPSNFSLPGHSFLARPARRDRPRPCGRPRPLRQLRRVRAISKPWPRSGGARVSPESPPLLEPLPLPLGPRVFGERRKRRSRAPSDPPQHPCLKLPRTEPSSATSPQPVLEPHPLSLIHISEPTRLGMIS